VPTMTASGAREVETGFIESAGQHVRYRVRGDGPPLLMIHGVGAPLELWRPLEAKLEDFQPITVDPPGSGHSSTPNGRFGMRDFAQVMEDLLEHLGVDSANVLGLSLGGMIAQELAHRSPERIEKLVLASTSCGWTLNPVAVGVIANRARYFSKRQRDMVTPIRYDPDSSLLRLQ